MHRKMFFFFLQQINPLCSVPTFLATLHTTMYRIRGMIRGRKHLHFRCIRECFLAKFFLQNKKNLCFMDQLMQAFIQLVHKQVATHLATR